MPAKRMDEVYTSIKLPTSVPGIGYTLKHRDCVEQLINWYCTRARNQGKLSELDCEIMRHRGICHDMDKVLTSLSYPQLTADYIHRMLQGHHEESFIEPQYKNKYDWMEMVFDMESAKYTKPDKQGGAYTFAKTYKGYLMKYLEPCFAMFGLNQDDTGFIPEIKESIDRDYYEEDLVKAFLRYIHCTKLHRLDGVSRIDAYGYYTATGKFVKFRRQLPFKAQRPNAVCAESNSIRRREFVQGTAEVGVFDMDALCNISYDEIANLNKLFYQCIKDMGYQYQR